MSNFVPNNYNKPSLPFSPMEPERPSSPNALADVEDSIVLSTIYNTQSDMDIFEISASDLIKKIEMLDDSDVKLRISSNYDYYDDCTDCCVEIVYIKKDEPNPNFDKEMKRYEKDKIKYEKDFAKYEKEMLKFKVAQAKYEENLKIWEEFERKREIKRLEKKLVSMKEDEKKLLKLKAGK